MQGKLEIQSIWWRNVQPGEFYNIERHHQIDGGGGSLYIEIPASLVAETLDFLGVTAADAEAGPIVVDASAVDDANVSGPIEFKSKAGGRLRIANQNRQAPNSLRHPAWTAARNFPSAPDTVGSKEDALPFFPKGGLRIYIAKSNAGEYFAGFTSGYRPANMSRNSPMWDLYPDGNRPVGGVIKAG
ncbi:hypothetical protein PH7735_00360 [Shimia thalassica]|uniref:Uncharacterized protein n=1 Tax=Shimia thalassica TaxID=1715693 RepID=A0A0P1I199_9RHOB|nr:hypothetical protein [Shimia thalassica]CUJ84286.1 hypothetical protein PH7735_00360 [Shimia thalassica]